MTRPGWATDSRDYRLVLAILLAACAIVPAGFAIQATLTDETLFPDFFGLWSFGRFVLTHPAPGIYNTSILFPFQAGFGMAHEFYPFPYPPWILLLLAPLAVLPFAAAMPLWLAATFAAMTLAVRAWTWPRLLAGFLLVAPSSAIEFLTGQNGFFSAALMLGGLRLLPTHPFTAGALLAAVAYKPQLAVLLPFVLLVGWHTRAMLGAAVTALILSLASTLAFGSGIWPAWLAAMRAQAAGLSLGRATLLDMMPTVSSAISLTNGAPWLAHAAQIAAAALALFAVWRVRRRHDPTAQAVIPLATILATPYAFHYDLPMITGAILALMATTAWLSTARLLAYLGCLLSPALLVARAGPLSAAVPLVFAITLLMLLHTTKAGAPPLVGVQGAKPPRAKHAGA
jgi:hypothetical protein